MKKLIIYSLIFAGTFSISGCKKNHTTAQSVEVRVFNATTWTFTDCIVDPAGTLSNVPSAKAYTYGLVDTNTASAYHSFDEIYRYAWFRLTMNSKTYYIKVYDYVGETPLSNGKYTYKLTYSASGDNLNLELIHD